MRDQVQRPVENAIRLNSLLSHDRKGHATSPVVDEVIPSGASRTQAPSWNMELI